MGADTARTSVFTRIVLAVGLLLAFAVASMPQPTGKHYYFEIMLPGGIVGMIVGYATQRFGTPLLSPR